MTGLNPMDPNNLNSPAPLTPEEVMWMHNQAVDVADNYGLNPKTSAQRIAEKRELIKEQILSHIKEDQENGEIFVGEDLDSEKMQAIVDIIIETASDIKYGQIDEAKQSIDEDKAATNFTNREKFAYGMKPAAQEPGFFERLKTPAVEPGLLGRLKKRPARDAKVYSAEEAEDKALNLRHIKIENAGYARQLREMSDTSKQSEVKIQQQRAELATLEKEIEGLSKELTSFKAQMEKNKKAINNITDFVIAADEEENLAGSGFFSRLSKRIKSLRKSSSMKKTQSSAETTFVAQSKLQEEMLKLEKTITDLLNNYGEAAEIDDLEEINEVHFTDLEYTDLVDRHNSLAIRLGRLAEKLDRAISLKKEEHASKAEDLEHEKEKLQENEASRKSIKEQLDSEALQSPAERRRIFYSKFADRIAYIRSMQKSLHKVAVYGESRRLSRIETISRLYFELRSEVMNFEVITGVKGFVTILNIELGEIDVPKTADNPKAEAAVNNLEEIRKALAYAERGRQARFKEAVEARAREMHEEFKKAEQARTSTPPLAEQPKVEVEVGGGDKPDAEKPAPLSVQPKIDVEVGDGDSEPEPVSAPPIDDEPEPATDIPKVDPSFIAGSFIGVDFNQRKFDLFPALKDVEFKFAFGDAGEAPKASEEKEEEPPTTRKSTEKKEKKESKETLRESETLYIGDLNGSYSAFVKNMTALKAMRIENPAPGVDKLIWTAGNRKVVLLGDYLGDRTPEGFKIALAIADLMEQAREQGGVIQILYGNHEDWMVRFLLDIELLGIPGSTNRYAMFKNALMNNNQGYGLLEPLKKFTARGENFSGTMDEFKDDLVKTVPMDTSGFKAIDSLANEAFDNMRKPENKEGRRILEQICQMKLVAMDDKNLILHTDLTTEILNDLIGSASGPKNWVELKMVVKNLNDEFQALLRDLLLQESTPDRQEKKDKLRKLAETYADTRNRDFNSSDPQNAILLKKLADIGIKSVIHGHSFNHGKPVTTTGSGVDLVNLDFGVDHPTHGVADDVRSVGYFGRDRKFRLGADEVKDLEEHKFSNKVVLKLVNWLEDIFPLTDRPKYKIAMRILNDLALDKDDKPRSEDQINEVADRIVGDNNFNRVMMYLATGERAGSETIKPEHRLTLNFNDIKYAYNAVVLLFNEEPRLRLEQICEVLANVDFRSNNFEKQAHRYIRERRARSSSRVSSRPAPEAPAPKPAAEEKKEEPAVETKPATEPDKKVETVEPDKDFVQESIKKISTPSAMVSTALEHYFAKNPAERALLTENMRNYMEVFEFIFGGEFEGVKFTTKKMKAVKIGENGMAPELILANLLKYGLDTAKLAAKQKELHDLKMAAAGTLTADVIQKYIKDIYSGNLISFARDNK